MVLILKLMLHQCKHMKFTGAAEKLDLGASVVLYYGKNDFCTLSFPSPCPVGCSGHLGPHGESRGLPGNWWPEGFTPACFYFCFLYLQTLPYRTCCTLFLFLRLVSFPAHSLRWGLQVMDEHWGAVVGTQGPGSLPSSASACNLKGLVAGLGQGWSPSAASELGVLLECEGSQGVLAEAWGSPWRWMCPSASSRCFTLGMCIPLLEARAPGRALN